MKIVYVLLGTALTAAVTLGASAAHAGDSRVHFQVNVGAPVYHAPPAYLHPHVVYQPQVVYHPHAGYYNYSGYAPHYQPHYKQHGQHGNPHQVRDYPLHNSGGYAGSVRGGHR